MELLTVDAIDLNLVLVDGSVIRGSGPAERGGIRSDAGEGHIGRLGNLDAEDVDQVWDGFPEGLP